MLQLSFKQCYSNTTIVPILLYVDYRVNPLDTAVMMRTRDETVIEAFSDVLRQERDRVGLSQEALALECGIARTYIGLLEARKRQPALSILFAIARGLSVSPHTLIARVEKRTAELVEAGR